MSSTSVNADWAGQQQQKKKKNTNSCLGNSKDFWDAKDLPLPGIYIVYDIVQSSLTLNKLTTVQNISLCKEMQILHCLLYIWTLDTCNIQIIPVMYTTVTNLTSPSEHLVHHVSKTHKFPPCFDGVTSLYFDVMRTKNRAGEREDSQKCGI